MSFTVDIDNLTASLEEKEAMDLAIKCIERVAKIKDNTFKQEVEEFYAAFTLLMAHPFYAEMAETKL